MADTIPTAPQPGSAAYWSAECSYALGHHASHVREGVAAAPASSSFYSAGGLAGPASQCCPTAGASAAPGGRQEAADFTPFQDESRGAPMLGKLQRQQTPPGDACAAPCGPEHFPAGPGGSPPSPHAIAPGPGPSPPNLGGILPSLGGTPHSLGGISAGFYHIPTTPSATAFGLGGIPSGPSVPFGLSGIPSQQAPGAVLTPATGNAPPGAADLEAQPDRAWNVSVIKQDVPSPGYCLAIQPGSPTGAAASVYIERPTYLSALPGVEVSDADPQLWPPQCFQLLRFLENLINDMGQHLPILSCGEALPSPTLAGELLRDLVATTHPTQAIKPVRLLPNASPGRVTTFCLIFTYLARYLYGSRAPADRVGIQAQDPKHVVMASLAKLTGPCGWRPDRGNDAWTCYTRWGAAYTHPWTMYPVEFQAPVEALLRTMRLRDPAHILDALHDAESGIDFPYLCSQGRPKVGMERFEGSRKLSCIPPSCGRHKGCRQGFVVMGDLLEAVTPKQVTAPKIKSEPGTKRKAAGTKRKAAGPADAVEAGAADEAWAASAAAAAPAAAPTKPSVADILVELDLQRGDALKDLVPDPLRIAVLAEVVACARGTGLGAAFMGALARRALATVIEAGLCGPGQVPELLLLSEARAVAAAVLARVQAAATAQQQLQPPRVPPQAQPQPPVQAPAPAQVQPDAVAMQVGACTQQLQRRMRELEEHVRALEAHIESRQQILRGLDAQIQQHPARGLLSGPSDGGPAAGAGQAEPADASDPGPMELCAGEPTQPAPMDAEDGPHMPTGGLPAVQPAPQPASPAPLGPAASSSLEPPTVDVQQPPSPSQHTGLDDLAPLRPLCANETDIGTSHGVDTVLGGWLRQLGAASSGAGPGVDNELEGLLIGGLGLEELPVPADLLDGIGQLAAALGAQAPVVDVMAILGPAETELPGPAAQPLAPATAGPCPQPPARPLRIGPSDPADPAGSGTSGEDREVQAPAPDAGGPDGPAEAQAPAQPALRSGDHAAQQQPALAVPRPSLYDPRLSQAALLGRALDRMAAATRANRDKVVLRGPALRRLLAAKLSVKELEAWVESIAKQAAKAGPGVASAFGAIHAFEALPPVGVLVLHCAGPAAAAAVKEAAAAALGLERQAVAPGSAADARMAEAAGAAKAVDVDVAEAVAVAGAAPGAAATKGAEAEATEAATEEEASEVLLAGLDVRYELLKELMEIWPTPPEAEAERSCLGAEEKEVENARSKVLGDALQGVPRPVYMIGPASCVGQVRPGETVCR